MKNRQKFFIAAVLLAPIIIGVFLLIKGDKSQSAVVGGSFTKKIGLVSIINEIIVSETYVKQLREMRSDRSIAGVILRIDSPGGAVAPSQEIYSEVMRFRNENKPLVVSMGNIAASGGYYIASPAMKIFANPGTITGSIGVILRFPQYYKLMDKIGVNMETIKSGEYKDVGNPNRSLSKKEREYLQKFLDDTYNQFIEDVSRARQMEVDSVMPMADGRVFTGRQAKEIGLIDSVGGYQDAVSFLKSHLGLPEKTKIVEKKRHSSFLKEILLEELFKKVPFIHSIARPLGSYYLFESY